MKRMVKLILLKGNGVDIGNIDINALYSYCLVLVKAITISTGLSSQTEMENVEEDSETAAGKRKQKHTAAASSVKRQTRQTRRQSAEAAGPVNKEERASVANDDLFAGPSSPAEVIAEEFDTYLDSLVSSIAQPLSDAPLPHTISVNSFFQDNEFAESQGNKSSF